MNRNEALLCDWKDINENPITKSGFYKILLENGNIHYCKYIKPGSFQSGRYKDYRNGDHYPIRYPIKYIYIHGLNNKWELDQKVKEEDWTEGM